MITGYVSGVFDMFHIGHLNIIIQARRRCDRLVVGVVDDAVVRNVKAKDPVIPLEERIAIVTHLSAVDEVVVDRHADKFDTWQELHYDVIFKGDDWKGTSKGDKLEADLAAVGARVEYFPYTRHTSSTLLRDVLTTLAATPVEPLPVDPTEVAERDAAPGVALPGAPAPTAQAPVLLVTGGAGFVGSNFVRRVLAEGGHDVVVLDKLTHSGDASTLDDLSPDHCELVVGDVLDGPLVDELVGQSDAVVHFAAEAHTDGALLDPTPFVTTNVEGTYRVLEAVRRHGVRLHHVSTDEVYGDLGDVSGARFTESSPYVPSSPYSATKAGADHLVRAWVRSFGVRATLSHCGNNYGPYQRVERFIPRQITNLLDGERPHIFGDGGHVRDWVHVDDHSTALMRILRDGRLGRSYLIGADGERTNLEVVQLLLEIMGMPAGGYDLVTDRIGHDRRYAVDATVLRAELGWVPQRTDFRAGLEETVAWYREHEGWWRHQKAVTEARYAATGERALRPRGAPA